MLKTEQDRYNGLESLEAKKEAEKEENYISQEEFLKISDGYKDVVKKEELINKIFEIKKEIENQNIEAEKINFEIKTAEIEKNNFEKELSEIKDISQNDIFSLEKTILEKNSILKSLKEKEQEIVNLEIKLKKFKVEIEDKNSELLKLENIEKDFLEEREKYFIYELRKNLHSGDICPVCSKIYEEKNISVKDNETVDFNKEEFEKVRADINILKSSVLSTQEKIREIELKSAQLKEDIQVIDLLEKEISEIVSEKTNLEKKYNETTEKKLKLEKDLKNIISKINILQINYNRYESNILLKKDILSDVQKEADNIPETEFPKDILEKKLKNIKEKNIIYKNLEKELLEIRKTKKDIYDNKIIKWSDKIREKEKELAQKEQNYENLKSDYLVLNSEIEKVLLENKISDLQELSVIETYSDKIDEMKSLIKDYKDKSIFVLNTILDVQKELKNRTFLKEEYEKLIEYDKIIKVSLEKNNQIIGEIRKSIEIFNQNKNRAETLFIKKRELEKELDPAKELAKLLEGRKFLDFLSAGKLQSITREASNTLQKITNGRYRINVDEKSDFSIIDNFNSSVRKPQSLSGGETFMVSLCLALALADQIQLRGKSRLEFFFLDEGFGTLDSELLEIVFGVLENLRAEGMTVGIITHVEEIKNRVARKLLVTPAKIGESGTVVKEI